MASEKGEVTVPLSTTTESSKAQLGNSHQPPDVDTITTHGKDEALIQLEISQKSQLLQQQQVDPPPDNSLTKDLQQQQLYTPEPLERHSFTPRRTLEYNPNDLTWDSDHFTNAEDKYCYCGGGRRFAPYVNGSEMYGCGKCNNWFHPDCCEVFKGIRVFHGDVNYVFVCGNCGNGEETFMRGLMGWVDFVLVTLYNMHVKNPNTSMFNLRNVICKEMVNNWEFLGIGRAHTKTWWATVGSAVSTRRHIFEGMDGSWGIKDRHNAYWKNLNLESQRKILQSKEKKLNSVKRSRSTAESSDGTSPKKKKKESKKQRKRHDLDKIPNISIDVNDVDQLRKYFYIPKIPKEYGRVRYSKLRIAKDMKLSEDLLEAWSVAGYRSVLSTVSVTEGTWFWEGLVCHSEDPLIRPENHERGSLRVGWATSQVDVETPCGYEKFGYAFGDKNGNKIHSALSELYGVECMVGDTIGCLISLGSMTERQKKTAKQQDTDLERLLLTERSSVGGAKKEQFFQMKREGSFVEFLVNGKSQGIAYSDLYHGEYFAIASSYMGGRFRANFGPKFKYPPITVDFRPLSDLEEEEPIEELEKVEKVESEQNSKVTSNLENVVEHADSKADIGMGQVEVRTEHEELAAKSIDVIQADSINKSNI